MSSHEEVVVEQWSFLFEKSGMVPTNLGGRRDGLRLFLWDQNNQNYIVSSQHQVQLVFDSSSLILPFFCLSSDPGQESTGQLSRGWSLFGLRIYLCFLMMMRFRGSRQLQEPPGKYGAECGPDEGQFLGA